MYVRFTGSEVFCVRKVHRTLAATLRAITPEEPPVGVSDYEPKVQEYFHSMQVFSWLFLKYFQGRMISRPTRSYQFLMYSILP
jgi:hypothetical protein